MMTNDQMYNLVTEVGKEVARQVMNAAITNDPEAGDKVRGIYVTAACLQGALQAVASLVGWPKGQEEYLPTNRPRDCVNDDSILFAALLLAKMSGMVRKGDDAYTKVSFGPEELIAALDATEKVLGRPLGDGMDPALLERIREAKAEQSYTSESVDLSGFTTWPETLQ